MTERYNLHFYRCFVHLKPKKGSAKLPLQLLAWVSGTDLHGLAGYDKLEVPLTLRLWKVLPCAHQLQSMQQETEGELVPASSVPMSQLFFVHVKHMDHDF